MNANLDHELYEKARKRTRQKRRLYFHFVLFLIGSVFMILLNKVIKFQEDLDWYVWGIAAWFLLLVFHSVNVLVMKRFFNKDWERVQTEKLIVKHQKKLDKLETKLAKQGKLPQAKETSPQPSDSNETSAPKA